METVGLLLRCSEAPLVIYLVGWLVILLVACFARYLCSAGLVDCSVVQSLVSRLVFPSVGPSVC